MSSLYKTDPEVKKILDLEITRHNETLDMIASENYPSPAVYEAQSSILTSKYAEGYPGRRYYAGCEQADAIETLAVERLKELYKAEYANVQPHSGSQANTAAYYALLEYGDTVLSMHMNIGGHLTHGEKINFSGRTFNFIRHGVSEETERLDFVELEKLVKEYQPKMIVTGASAYPRIIDFEKYRYLADLVGAKLMVDIAHTAGMVAAGLHPSPVPYADIVTSTTHKTLRGPRGGIILAREEYAHALDMAVFPGVQGGPMMHTIAAKAVAFYEALQPEFAEYQQKVIDNAYTLAEELKKLGIPLVSGGTDTHLMIVKLTHTDITGKQFEDVLCKAGIVANREPIPFDPLPPRKTSGVRFGTPAITSRGMGENEMKRIAALIMRVLQNIDNEKVINEVKAEVAELCSGFPLPGINN
ncbi:MAG: serine hydroxymethyltransferase [Dehalococcoidales bacterium]|nr:serine hydroxymethyltransferase [Dehalococcoidales bacterium]